MARNRDIAGLLTGIPSNGFAENMMQMSRELGSRFGSGVTGMITGDIRTPTQRLTGDIKNFQNLSEEEQRGLIGRLQARGETGIASQLRADLAESARQKQAQALSQATAGLDLNTPEGLIKLAEIQKAQGKLAESAQTVAKAQKLKNIANRKESLLKVARAQGNELIEEYLLQAGDTDSALNKVQEVLFRREPTFKSTAAPTKSDITLYEKLLEQYTDKELKALGIPTGFSFLGIGGGVDDADKLIIINNAKEIATNFPKLGKKAALAEALRQYGISKSAESMPTGTPTDTNVVESSSQMTGAPIK